jgi:hypothetical protein
LREGNDPVRDAISELTEAGGRNAEWLRVLTIAYAAHVVLGVCLIALSRADRAPRRDLVPREES